MKTRLVSYLGEVPERENEGESRTKADHLVFLSLLSPWLFAW